MAQFAQQARLPVTHPNTPPFVSQTSNHSAGLHSGAFGNAYGKEYAPPSSELREKSRRKPAGWYTPPPIGRGYEPGTGQTERNARRAAKRAKANSRETQ